MSHINNRASTEVECGTDLATLGSPNHRMVEVDVFIRATDAWMHPADLVLQEVIVASDEPDDAKGTGDVNTTGDADGQDGFTSPVDLTRLGISPSTPRQDVLKDRSCCVRNGQEAKGAAPTQSR